MTSSSGTVSWVKNIGHRLINNVNLEIGGQEIDKQYSDWFNIWNELAISPGHKAGYADMIGNTPDLVSTTGSTDLPAKTLYVPLQFWFNRNVGLSYLTCVFDLNSAGVQHQMSTSMVAPTQTYATSTSESQTRDNFQLRETPKTVKSDIESLMNPHKASRTSQILNKNHTMPTCNKCNVEKPESAFERRKDSGTLRKACLDCTRAQKMEIYRRKHPEQPPKPVDPRTIGQVRTCRVCEIEKPLADFNKATAGGFERQCKSCQSKYMARYKQELADGTRTKLEFPIDEENQIKLCSECNEWKTFEEFPKRDNEHGRRHQCRACFNKRARLYEASNESVKLGLVLRKHTYSFLISSGKKNPTGLKKPALRSWFEFQFDEDLSWDNYPTAWTIDHVVPVAAFDLTDENQYKLCAHWTNLQPHRDNLGKNNSIRIWEVMAHKKRVEEFIGENETLSEEYQVVVERLRFLEQKFGIGKNLTDEVEIVEIPAETDNPQRSP